MPCVCRLRTMGLKFTVGFEKVASGGRVFVPLVLSPIARNSGLQSFQSLRRYSDWPLLRMMQRGVLLPDLSLVCILAPLSKFARVYSLTRIDIQGDINLNPARSCIS